METYISYYLEQFNIDSHSYQFQNGPPGKFYRPSNALEGFHFYSLFCENCTKDDIPNDDLCPIIADAECYSITHEKYPKQWIFDESRKPICKEFDPIMTPGLIEQMNIDAGQMSYLDPSGELVIFSLENSG